MQLENKVQLKTIREDVADFDMIYYFFNRIVYLTL